MSKWPSKAHYESEEVLSHQAQDDLSLGEAIQQFVLMARVDGRAHKTIELYNYVFDSFTGFIGDPPLAQINPASIRFYLVHLQERGLKRTSVAIHHRVLRAFFNWLVREGYLKWAPTEPIREPRTPKRFPFVLSDVQVAALLRVAEKGSKSWTGYRNYTMLLTFLDVGLRLTELIGLELGDLNLAQRSLKVHGKGAKDRVCFMGARLTKAMRRWIDLRGYQPYSEEVFISRIGDRLKPRYVQQVIQRLGKKAGLERVRVSPHTLRHTAATLAVRNGLDVFSLQRLFGWERVETAMRYVHMSGRALQEAFARTSPIDRLLG